MPRKLKRKYEIRKMSWGYWEVTEFNLDGTQKESILFSTREAARKWVRNRRKKASSIAPSGRSEGRQSDHSGKVEKP